MVIRSKNPLHQTSQIKSDQSRGVEKDQSKNSGLAEPNQGLGLSKTATTSPHSAQLATSPMFLGVSRSERSTKAEYRHVCKSLQGVDSTSAKKLCEALAKTGYQQKDGSNNVKGDDRVKLSPLKLGNNEGHRIEFSRGKKTIEAVSFSDSVIPIGQWELMQERYNTVIERFDRARQKNPDVELPTDLASLKSFLDQGKTKKKRKKDLAREKEISKALDALSDKLSVLQENGKAPKGIVIYVAGPDAAGKSSTGAIVMGALEKAGYQSRRESFKAPSKEERAQHWLKRFERGVPQTQEAVFWDRGPAGDSVYGGASAERTRTMGKEFSGFEAELRDDGILMMKIELFADIEKQSETFGKRLGRQFVAQSIMKELEQANRLTAKQKSDLQMIADKVDADDFRALANFEDIQNRFLDFVNHSNDTDPWQVTDATQRHEARLSLIDQFEARLDKFVAA